MHFLFLTAAFLLLTNLQADIGDYFKKAPNKSPNHKMAGIDFIYMINLDQRPERYQRTINALSPYDIHPYRFSAVNGWKLPNNALDQLGITFQQGMPNGPIATVFSP